MCSASACCLASARRLIWCDAALRQSDLTLATIPPEDPAVYEHALPRRLARRVSGRKPRADDHAAAARSRRNFYDLVIEVAIVRPGPIQGDMVHPYLRRRRGQEADHLSVEGTGSCSVEDPGRAAVSGAGDENRHRCRRLHARRRPTSCAAPWRPSSASAPSALSSAR